MAAHDGRTDGSPALNGSGRGRRGREIRLSFALRWRHEATAQGSLYGTHEAVTSRARAVDPVAP